jgi:hypothetical protein
MNTTFKDKNNSLPQCTCENDKNIVTANKNDHLSSIKSTYLLADFQHFYFNTIPNKLANKTANIPNPIELSRVQQASESKRPKRCST